MKKINISFEAIPTWVYVLAFFATVAAAYILLNHFLGFDNTAWLVR